MRKARVIVEVRATNGGSFKPNANGDYPFLLSDTLNNNKRLAFGGIVDGTVGKNMGLKDFHVYDMNLEEYQSKNINPNTNEHYINVSHKAISCLTDDINKVMAEKIVKKTFSSYSIGGGDPIEGKKEPSLSPDEQKVIAKLEAADDDDMRSSLVKKFKKAMKDADKEISPSAKAKIQALVPETVF